MSKKSIEWHIDCLCNMNFHVGAKLANLGGLLW